VGLGSAFDDGQAEADTGVIGAYGFSAAKEWFHECGRQLRTELVERDGVVEARAVDESPPCSHTSARVTSGR
jgi:hypothetical protein